MKVDESLEQLLEQRAHASEAWREVSSRHVHLGNNPQANALMEHMDRLDRQIGEARAAHAAPECGGLA